MQQFKGRSERALVRDANRWFREYVEPTIYPEAVELVREHAERGHVVAIVSGATKFVLRPLADHLRIKHVMHTHLEVRDGRFTGRVIDPICFGEGKIYWLQQLIEQEGIDLAKSFFYTDSITDLPLLDLVGHPQVVNPDPLLYRRAVRRHWPVRFFQAPHDFRARGRELAEGTSDA
jgi:HAD superfamily hydrolase (TIGR01490 family)